MMNRYKLSIEHDEDNRQVFLVTESATGRKERELVGLRDGFDRDHVQEALLATGLITLDADGMQINDDFIYSLRSRSLSELVENMFGYFNHPDEPTEELLEIQSALAEYDGQSGPRRDIPPFAYAWLDIILRESIAEQARTCDGLWTELKLEIGLERVRRALMDQFLSRYAKSGIDVVARMASSRPTRPIDTRRDAKRG